MRKHNRNASVDFAGLVVLSAIVSVSHLSVLTSFEKHLVLRKPCIMFISRSTSVGTNNHKSIVHYNLKLKNQKNNVQYPQRYFLQVYPFLSCVNLILSCVYAVLSCVYPILSFVNPIMLANVSCVYRLFRVSVIHSEVTRRSTVYIIKTRGVPVVVSFCFKKIILRNRSYVNMVLNSRGRRMPEKIKMVIVQYLLMH